MRIEYLLFNILVLLGPAILSFHPKYMFIRNWVPALLAIVFVAVPFILWDALVAGNHWTFNPAFTSGLQVFNLPVSELAFFLTVPFACLFTWEILLRNQQKQQVIPDWLIFILISVFLVSGIFALLSGKTYTGTVSLVWSLVLGYGILGRDSLVSKPVFWKYLGVITLFILVFNGYLTARPVVLYNPEVITGWHIGTIPVEDFLYGYSLIGLNVMVYEKFRRKLYRNELTTSSPKQPTIQIQHSRCIVTIKEKQR